MLKDSAASVEKFLSSLPGDADSEASLPDFSKITHPWIETASKALSESETKDEGFVVPTQVSYVGKGGLVYRPGESVPGSSAVVSRFLRTGYLWDRVRVIGGAYGGFCAFDPADGFFAFLSYRDPNLADTLDVYDAAADELADAAVRMRDDPEGLAQAIIGTIGDMDGPKSADQKGWISLARHLKNESAEHRQRVRDEVLATTAEDFTEFGKRLKAMHSPSVAVVGSKAAFDDAKKAGKDMHLTDVF